MKLLRVGASGAETPEEEDFRRAPARFPCQLLLRAHLQGTSSTPDAGRRRNRNETEADVHGGRTDGSTGAR